MFAARETRAAANSRERVTRLASSVLDSSGPTSGRPVPRRRTLPNHGGGVLADRFGAANAVLEEIRGTRDAISVRRVFGDPVSADGVTIIPVGVHEIRDGHLDWKPAIDVDRVVRGTQVLAAITTVCITLVLLRRRR